MPGEKTEGFQDPRADDKADLLDLLIVIAKRKKLIILITLGAAVFAIIAGFIMTPMYQAETTILPPEQSDTASQLFNKLGGVGGLLGMAGVIKNPEDMYIDMLGSRYVRGRVIRRFKLNEREREALEPGKNLMVSSDLKSGIMTIDVLDKDPRRAADMANAFVEELQDLCNRLSEDKAQQRKLFFEEQLNEAKTALAKSEANLQTFEEKTGAVDVKDQANALFEGVKDLMTQIAAAEVQLKVMKTYSTPQNPDLQKSEAELQGLKNQLARLEGKSQDGRAVIPSGNIPAISTGYERAMRDVKFNGDVYKYLLEQYEGAKLNEADDPMIIQVLDKASPPVKRAKPKRILLALMASVFAFFCSICLVFLMDYIKKKFGGPEDRAKLKIMKDLLLFKRRMHS